MTLMTMPVAKTAGELATIELVTGMPGFANLRSFVLESLDEDGLLYRFQSLEDPAVRLLVAPPAPFFPHYEAEIDDESAARLGLTSAEDAVLFVVITVGESPAEATANLLAPIVVNQQTRAAAQVILTGSNQPLRAALRAR